MRGVAAAGGCCVASAPTQRGALRRLPDAHNAAARLPQQQRSTAAALLQQQQRRQQQQRPPAARRRVVLRAAAAAAAEAAIAPPNPNAPRGPVVVVDNYDSFTYNLCQYLGDAGCDYIVFPNDAKSVAEIAAMNPRGILVSPGPGRPEDSGISLEIIQKLGPLGFPVFGVCMGHQCIGQVFGGNVVRAPSGVMHGKTSPVWHTNTGLVEGLDNPFKAARYHSLVIEKDSCPEELEVTAWCEDGTIMAVRHKAYPHIQGVQFHPESIITDNGMRIVRNFVDSLPRA
ncbi:anthranilate synthase component II [Micractinium conductrix]|uniref:Anthranilate synthase component 2 n=1 Tax=Micractinium conductrix TaxID=554055 RepID=A0A2P6V0B0_9CHLO|nr:anthranilate synthase component II [Micractinium conductrix]|eukprot:PSC67532.1 anthranilate synthase component II [Micractinium conductrix]